MQEPMIPSNKAIREYVKFGEGCLCCGQYDIEYGDIDGEDAVLIQFVKCNKCKSSWNEVFRRVNITEIQLG